MATAAVLSPSPSLLSSLSQPAIPSPLTPSRPPLCPALFQPHPPSSTPSTPSTPGSPDAPQDVIALAQAYLLRRESQRAALLLQRTGLAQRSLSGRYLLAQAHAADEQWERVLDVLGADTASAPPLAATPAQDAAAEGVPGAASALCVLRAKAHERLDNRDDTVKAYTEALRHDPLCIEAFQALTARCMLTPEQSQ